MPTISKTEDGGWHLDKRVPITLILAIIAQTISFVWFFSKMDSRIQALETAALSQKDRDDRQDRTAAEILSSLRMDIKEVDRKLDRLIERERK